MQHFHYLLYKTPEDLIKQLEELKSALDDLKKWRKDIDVSKGLDFDISLSHIRFSVCRDFDANVSTTTKMCTFYFRTFTTSVLLFNTVFCLLSFIYLN